MTVSGTVRDVNGRPPSSTSRDFGLPIVVPKLGLTIIADPATGTVPLTVVYHFTLTNLGTPADPLGSVQSGAPVLPARLYESGDSDARQGDRRDRDLAL